MIVSDPDELSPDHRDVELFASARSDLDWVSELPDLERLRLTAVPVTDLRGLLAAPKLAHLDLSFCPVVDLSPLADHPSLRKIQVMGCPIDEASRAMDRVLVEPEVVWKLCRRLHAQVGFCYGEPGGRSRTVRPGPGEHGVLDWLQAPRMYVEQDLDEDRREDWFPKKDRPIDPATLRWRRTAVDAREVEAAAADLDPELAASIVRFAPRFDALFVEDDDLIAAFEAQHGVTLPDWYRALRRDVLAGVDPSKEIPIFEMDPESGFPTHLEAGWVGYLNTDHQKVLSEAGFFPIAARVQVRTDGTSVGGYDPQFLIRLDDPADRRLFVVKRTADLWEWSSDDTSHWDFIDPVAEHIGVLFDATRRIRGAEERWFEPRSEAL